MPTPNTVFSALQSSRLSGVFPFAGVTWEPLALAISNGVSTWASIPSNLALTGTTVGTAGVGPVAGVLTVPPNPPAFNAAFLAAGFTGPVAPSLALVLANAMSQAFTGAAYVGTSTGVGSGSDTSLITTANPGTLASILTPLFGVGPTAASLALGVANGVCTQLLAGFGVGSVNGPPSPTGASGVSISTVI
jgi:hypothetical protein